MPIVNADDLGYDARTNAAIIRSFKLQLCTSATLLANMEGFQEACDLVHELGVADRVGLHLNLSEGLPLTEAIRRCPRFCDREGRFRLLRRERVIWLGSGEREALAAEVRAQIRQLRAMRIPITHLDSHKSLHEEWGIATTLIPLLKEAGIPALRLARNIGKSTSLVKGAYRTLLNRWLRCRGVARTRYFGSLTDYLDERACGNLGRIEPSCEVMIHPGFDDQGELVDQFFETITGLRRLEPHLMDAVGIRGDLR